MIDNFRGTDISFSFIRAKFHHKIDDSIRKASQFGTFFLLFSYRPRSIPETGIHYCFFTASAKAPVTLRKQLLFTFLMVHHLISSLVVTVHSNTLRDAQKRKKICIDPA